MRRAGWVVVAVLLAACSSGAGSRATTTTTSTTTTTLATTTTIALLPQATAVDAVDAFVQAWRDGDQAAAATYALAPAVQAAFAAGVPARLTNRGCMSGDVDPISCVYASELGEVQVRATQQGGGWIVDQVEVTPD